MTKEQFLQKNELSELDYRNLIRYEVARKTGKMNMNVYLYLMKKYNINGGERLATWIVKEGNYEEFLSTLVKEEQE